MYALHKYFCMILMAGIAAGCGGKTTLKAPDLSSAAYQVQPSDLKLSIVKDTSVADGVSYDAVQLNAGPSVTSRYDTVIFAVAPLGVFTNGSTSVRIPVAANGQSQAFLVSRVTGTTTVTVSVGGVTQSIRTISRPRSSAGPQIYGYLTLRTTAINIIFS